MTDRLLDQLEVRVREKGNLLDAVYTVNPGQHPQHGQVPILVYKILKMDGTERHMMGVQGRGRWICRKELDIERVGGVDGNHSLAVIIQIFEQYFTQRIDFPRVRLRSILRQELTLFLERAKQRVEFPHYGDVRGEIRIFGQDETKVERVRVARIEGGSDVLWVTQDTVVGGSQLEETGIADGGVRDDEVGYRGEMQERNGRCGGRGGNGGSGDLMDDLWAYTFVSLG